MQCTLYYDPHGEGDAVHYVMEEGFLLDLCRWTWNIPELTVRYHKVVGCTGIDLVYAHQGSVLEESLYNNMSLPKKKHRYDNLLIVISICPTWIVEESVVERLGGMFYPVYEKYVKSVSGTLPIEKSLPLSRGWQLMEIAFPGHHIEHNMLAIKVTSLLLCPSGWRKIRNIFLLGDQVGNKDMIKYVILLVVSN